MEKLLKNAFDYYRFEGNPRLGRLIMQSENRYEGQLSDDALELVSAAGEPQYTPAADASENNNV